MNGFFSKIIRYILPCIIICICIISCVPLASATDVTEPTEFIEPTVTENQNLGVPEPMVLTNVSTDVRSVGPSDANGFKKILLQLFGDYDMITKEYTYTSTNGYTSKQVTTESDYPWMISAGIFTVVLYSLLDC